MSIHTSLKSKDKGRQHRSVLKRFEKIRKLKGEDKWDEEEDSVFGLPKVKIIKIAAKKRKAAEAAVPAGAEAEVVEGAEVTQKEKEAPASKGETTAKDKGDKK